MGFGVKELGVRVQGLYSIEIKCEDLGIWVKSLVRGKEYWAGFPLHTAEAHVKLDRVIVAGFILRHLSYHLENKLNTIDYEHCAIVAR